MGRTCNVKFTQKRKETHTVRLPNAQLTARRTPSAHGPRITTPRSRKARGKTQAEKSSNRRSRNRSSSCEPSTVHVHPCWRLWDERERRLRTREHDQESVHEFELYPKQHLQAPSRLVHRTFERLFLIICQEIYRRHWVDLAEFHHSRSLSGVHFRLTSFLSLDESYFFDFLTPETLHDQFTMWIQCTSIRKTSSAHPWSQPRRHYAHLASVTEVHRVLGSRISSHRDKKVHRLDLILRAFT